MPDKNLKFHSADGKRKILLIEDEPINREILSMMLADSYDVLCAEDGARSLELLDAHCETLSLVLLDLNLPDMRGIDILRRIKASERMGLLPVIVMTADQEAEVECLSLGAIDFIPKPYPKQEVVRARILRTIELYEDRDIIRFTERDHLTGLYNREFFYHYADQFDSFHPNIPTDAIVLNINHFHMINERYGREFGDEVLRHVARKLLDSVEGTDGIVCRREDDTFLIYCPHRGDYTEMLNLICEDIGADYHVRARMGVYSHADRGIEIERRFDRAKQAADMVKGRYSHEVGIYDDAMREKELYNEQLLEDFHTAIREKHFTVFYQPKLDVRGDRPVLSSAEALIRWRHPQLGMVSPGVFIPLFEANGLVRELDAYVWREAAEQAARWKESLGRSIPVSVNVSRVDIDPRLPELMSSIADEAGLERRNLLLEITESAYTDNTEQIIAIVKDLQGRGFRIEMDDFGTGYSSLNMIAMLPFNALKLDMKFIRNAFSPRKDLRLLNAVIGLAKSLDLPIIAEGVETEEQMLTLRSIGCDIVQGYYFSKPLPAGEFEAFVRGMEA